MITAAERITGPDHGTESAECHDGSFWESVKFGEVSCGPMGALGYLEKASRIAQGLWMKLGSLRRGVECLFDGGLGGEGGPPFFLFSCFSRFSVF